MALHDTFITNEGADLLSYAAAGETLIWVRAATSNYNVDSKTDGEMTALTSILDSSDSSVIYTGDGIVSSQVNNDQMTLANISCQINNQTYTNGGPATLFGVWAKTSEHPTEKLVFVARRGTGQLTSNIAPQSTDPLYTLFITFSLRIDNWASPVSIQLTAAQDYYASADALDDEIDARESLASRVVTSHSASSTDSGEAQDVYGIKTFKNNTKHSGDILTTANTHSIGENTTAGRWNTVYATTFNGTSFTGNASTATAATNLSYSGTAKLTAENTQVTAKDDIIPNTNSNGTSGNGYSLGSSDFKWNTIYSYRVGASNTKISYGYFEYVSADYIRSGTTNIARISTTYISPYTSNSLDLGSSSYTWRNTFTSSITQAPISCTTDAGTQGKTATLTGLLLEAGTKILVKFTKGNSHASPTLNITTASGVTTGAKSINNLSTSLSTNKIVPLIYNGTSWDVDGTDVSKLALSFSSATSASAGSTLTVTCGSQSSNITLDKVRRAYADGSGNTITSYYCTLSTDQTITGKKTFSGTVYATTFDGTATKATADASGNNIKSSYASDLRTYTRAANSSSTVYGSENNRYIELYNKNSGVLSRVYLSDIIANALRGYGGFGYGTSTPGTSTAGYRTSSSFGSVGTLGLFVYQSGIGNEGTGWYSPGRKVSGTALRTAGIDYYASGYSFSIPTTSDQMYDVVTHSSTSQTSSYTTSSSSQPVTSSLSAFGDKQTGTWVLLSNSGYSSVYINLVLAVRIL